MAEGKIRLMDRLEASGVDIGLRYKFSDAYRNKDDTTRSLFGAPGSTTPGIFDLDPKMKRAKGADGFYSWHVTGPLGSPTFQPGARAGADAATPSRARRPPLKSTTKSKPSLLAPRAAVPPPPAQLPAPLPPVPVPAPVAAPEPVAPPAPAEEGPSPSDEGQDEVAE
jgi:hypothetical protein